jgi:hypothetical protein
MAHIRMTPWFQYPAAKPAHDGVYISSNEPETTDRLAKIRLDPYWFARYENGVWYRAVETPALAAKELYPSWNGGNRYWRGLTAPARLATA